MPAAWAIVGGLTLSGSAGRTDGRFRGLPDHWVSLIPAGNEMSHPMWYSRSFALQLRTAKPRQDIGLHGGLTGLMWDNARVTKAEIRREIRAGIDALAELGIHARSFVYPRNRECFHEFLVENDLAATVCGRSPVAWEKLTSRLPRAALRVIEEIGRFEPPVVWPSEYRPGLWNIPASLALYPMGRLRSQLVPLATRLRRFRLGIEAAVRSKGMFHFLSAPQ